MEKVTSVGSKINWFDIGFQIVVFALLIALIVFLIKFFKKVRK